MSLTEINTLNTRMWKFGGTRVKHDHGLSQRFRATERVSSGVRLENLVFARL